MDSVRAADRPVWAGVRHLWGFQDPVKGTEMQIKITMQDNSTNTWIKQSRKQGFEHAQINVSSY